MDAIVSAAGSSDAFAEEGANTAYEGFLEKLAVRWGVPPEVVPIIMMSFGCFLDGISDITFQVSLLSSIVHLWSDDADLNAGSGTESTKYGTQMQEIIMTIVAWNFNATPKMSSNAKESLTPQIYSTKKSIKNSKVLFV
jgi:hypothetical protein